MALIVQVTIVNEDTGEVERTYVETVSSRTPAWEAAQIVRQFLARMFSIAYPGGDEW